MNGRALLCALGAACLAGLAVDWLHDLDDVAGFWKLDREFSPQMSCEERDARYDQWQRAVERSLAWAPIE